MIKNLRHTVRNIFFAGLAFVLPLSITFIILNFLFVKLDRVFSPFFWGIFSFLPYSGKVSNHFPGFGIIMTLILIFLSGVFVKNIIGKRLVQVSEYLLYKIPLASNIYKATKQFFEGISGGGVDTFRSVVLVEFPRKGIYSIGFITGETKGEVQKLTEETLINVFVPTTPNPTSGYLAMVPESDLTNLSMTVEEGIKMVISGGIITPPVAEQQNF